MTKEILEKLRAEYPMGTRIELMHMEDFQAPPKGTHGTVTGVDDIGSIMVNWDTGGTLNVVYGEDIVSKVKYCCICGKEIYGYGNNPIPVVGKVCCDNCNSFVVVPYRVFLNNIESNSCGLLVKKDSLELITPKEGKFRLEELQKFVGGYIEKETEVFPGYITLADGEGKLKNKEFNELGHKLFNADLVGDFIIVPKKTVD